MKLMYKNFRVKLLEGYIGLKKGLLSEDTYWDEWDADVEVKFNPGDEFANYIDIPMEFIIAHPEVFKIVPEPGSNVFLFNEEEWESFNLEIRDKTVYVGCMPLKLEDVEEIVKHLRKLYREEIT